MPRMQRRKPAPETPTHLDRRQQRQALPARWNPPVALLRNRRQLRGRG